MLTKEKILSELKKNNDILKKYKVKKIGLFGSYSDNNQKEESDIDLIVDFEKTTFDNFMDLSFKLEEIFDKEIDLVTENGISPYIKPLIESGICWYETR